MHSNSHRKIFHAVLLIIAGFLAIFILYYFKFLKDVIPAPTEVWDSMATNNIEKCQSDGLQINFPRDEEKAINGLDRPLIPMEVKITDSQNTQINSFVIDNVPPNQEVYKIRDCAMYILRYWGFDYSNFQILPDYRFEVWKYSYIDENTELVFTFTDIKSSKPTLIYQTSFDIDPQEKYINLIKGYVGSEDYSFIIKSIDSGEDVVAILMQDIFAKYPGASGDISLIGWTKDDQYYWFRLFDGADTLAFVKVDASSGVWQLFDAPTGTMEGDPFNIEHAWVTYDDGPPWTGTKEFDAEYQQEWTSQNKQVFFYAYNVMTKEKILLDQTGDTTFWHKPKWIDDKTLEYIVQSGEVKMFTIDE
jgi:hypothetical protein